MIPVHTPTPWRVRPKINAKGERILNRIHPSIEGPQGESVASLAGPYRHGDVGHIVRCVNAHDDLVTALKRVEEDIEEFGGSVSAHGRQIVREALAKAQA